jgi:hypothetical protein
MVCLWAWQWNNAGLPTSVFSVFGPDFQTKFESSPESR